MVHFKHRSKWAPLCQKVEERYGRCSLKGLPSCPNQQCPVLGPTSGKVLHQLIWAWARSMGMTFSFQVQNKMTNEPKVCVFTPGVSGRGIPLGQNHHHSLGFVEGTGSRQWSKSSATSVKLREKLTLGINTKILAKASTALLHWPSPASPDLPQTHP